MPDRFDVDAYSSNDNFFSDSSSSAKKADHEKVTDALLNRVSLNQMTTRRWSMEQDIQAISNLGLKSIGLWRFKYEEFGEEETAQLLVDYDVNVSSISWVGGFTGAHGYIIDDCMKEAIDVIRYAGWVGASTVVVATGEQGRHILPHAQRLVVDSLKLLGDYAQQHNVQLAVMPMSTATAHGWTFLTSLQKACEMIRECNHSHVGLCLHSYHSLQDTKWKQMLPQISSLIKLVKICDGNTPKRPRKQCLPGEGQMHLPALFESLQKLGYQGLYEIDTWCEQHWKSDQTDQLQTSLDWLKESLPLSPA